MDLSWVEVAVIIACALGGFLITSAIVEVRRAKQKARQAGEDEAGKEAGEAEKQSRSENEGTARRGNERPWWEILGVSKAASFDEIKSAFRREIGRYHPDRVEGLGRELRELAEQKAKEINQAYAVAKRERHLM